VSAPRRRRDGPLAHAVVHPRQRRVDVRGSLRRDSLTALLVVLFVTSALAVFVAGRANVTLPTPMLVGGAPSGSEQPSGDGTPVSNATPTITRTQVTGAPTGSPSTASPTGPPSPVRTSTAPPASTATPVVPTGAPSGAVVVAASVDCPGAGRGWRGLTLVGEALTDGIITDGERGARIEATDTAFAFEAPWPFEAAIVSGTTTANLYRFVPPVDSAADLQAPGGTPIERVSLCYGPA